MDPMYIVNILQWIIRGTLVAINNAYCIPTYVIWMLMLSPLKFISAKLYWRIEGQFFYWLLTMVAFWSYSAGYHVIETGDDVNLLINEECMVLVNHQSTSDVPLLMAAFSTRNRLLQNLTWIMDGVFKFTNFGVVSVLHGDFFIAAGRDKRDATLVLLKSYLKNVYVTRHRKWIVLFPEGGFLRKRREASHRYAQRLNLPLLNHVTLPRLGAMQTIMDTIGPNSATDEPAENPRAENSTNPPSSCKIKYVIDMTIAYPKGRPLDLGSVVCGYDTPCEIRMHYRVFPVEQVPTEAEELQDWTYDRYIEKESVLGHYYRTGIWEPRLLILNKRDTAKWKKVAQRKESEGMEKKVSTESPSLSTVRLRSVERKGNEISPMNGSGNVDNSSATKVGLNCSLSGGNIVKCSVLINQTDAEENATAPISSKSKDSPTLPEEEEVSNGSQIQENSTENELQSEATVHRNSSNIEQGTAFSFPTPPEFGRRNQQDLLRIGMVHVFFIFSTAFHTYGIWWFYTYFQALLFS